MKLSIEQFNQLELNAAEETLSKCCGSKSWVKEILQHRPFANLEQMKECSGQANAVLSTEDWLQAFTHHPRIGDVEALREKFKSTADLASNEQSAVDVASEDVLLKLKDLNDQYFEKFGFIFIVCATGKSAVEMLTALESRIENTKETELKNASEEQAKITIIRLEKLFS